MKKQYALCLDVGGTEIKVNLLESTGETYWSQAKTYPAHATENKEAILANFKNIIVTHLKQIKELEVELSGIGLAFPGPFNYEMGWSEMLGLRKYDAIYRVNLSELIKSWLLELNFPVDIPLVFENDALTFAMGEAIFGQANEAKKAIFLTLGTGCGSAFIEDGQFVKNNYGLGETGMIYQDPLLDKTVDDYVSKAGLNQLTIQAGFGDLDGYELSLAAAEGSLEAQIVFQEFGLLIGQALKKYVAVFQPDCLVFGGQISKSLKWIKPGITASLSQEIAIFQSQDTTLSTLKGLTYLLKNNDSRRNSDAEKVEVVFN
ncbi:ROK family protein [Carnobacterium gallinarum]|uniref:ROK family protein n=1 Tax=Carnobacterium gallinarum TaxID=2749 RepID=UPI000558100A|nr:ROK family protein [Carnobacterium gallinarum]